MSGSFTFIMQIVALGLVFLVARVRNLSLRDDIGIILPRWKDIIPWVAGFIVLIFVEEFISQKFLGASPVESWHGKYSVPQMIFRGLGIAVLAPVSEELIFRGLLYSRIKATALKSAGAIVLPALIFSLIHIQYSEISTLTLIFLDGLYFGLARHYSKSVVLAILLHAIGNTGALLERIL